MKRKRWKTTVAAAQKNMSRRPTSGAECSERVFKDDSYTVFLSFLLKVSYLLNFSFPFSSFISLVFLV